MKDRGAERAKEVLVRKAASIRRASSLSRRCRWEVSVAAGGGERNFEGVTTFDV